MKPAGRHSYRVGSSEDPPCDRIQHVIGNILIEEVPKPGEKRRNPQSSGQVFVHSASAVTNPTSANPAAAVPRISDVQERFATRLAEVEKRLEAKVDTLSQGFSSSIQGQKTEIAAVRHEVQVTQQEVAKLHAGNADISSNLQRLAAAFEAQSKQLSELISAASSEHVHKVRVTKRQHDLGEFGIVRARVHIVVAIFWFMCSPPHLQPDLICKLDPRKKACHLSEESWQGLYPGSDLSCADLELWVFIHMANNATFCRAPAQHFPFCISITMTEPFVSQQCQCRAPLDISVLCTSCHSSHAAVLQRTRNKCMRSVNGNIGWIRVANPTSLHCNLDEVLALGKGCTCLAESQSHQLQSQGGWIFQCVRTTSPYGAR